MTPAAEPGTTTPAEEQARQAPVPGVRALAVPAHPDDRGVFRTTFDRAVLEEDLGQPVFPVAQVSHSVSRRGVVRGVHYARRAPGVAKVVHCAAGAVLDIVVDLRVGSPSLGQWDAYRLTAEGPALYLPPGVGHAFVALQDDTVVSYLLSRRYDPGDELVVSVFDPELGLSLPDLPLVLSDRDRAAPGLRAALAEGLLPLAEQMCG